MRLSEGSGPLYQQVVGLIRRNVESGIWKVGEQIPSEREMCELYAISRTTVRLAIAQAVHEGLLSRAHGKGTFVSPRKIRQPLVQFTAFAETLESEGLAPSTKVLAIRTVPADMATARLLRLPVGAEVVTFLLVGLGNGEPMSLYHSSLPARLGNRVRQELERRNGTNAFHLVNTLMAELYEWEHLKAEQTFEAIQAGPDEAHLLHLSRRAPLLRVDSLFENPSGEPVEYRRATYRADKYQFHVTRFMYFQRGRN